MYFYVINQKLVLPIISHHSNFDFIANDYLILIEHNLDTLLQFNVKINQNELIFDHLFILVVSEESATFLNEIDRYTIDFNRFILKSQNTNTERTGNPVVINRIKQKLNRICNKNLNTTTIATPTQITTVAAVATPTNTNMGANRVVTFGTNSTKPTKPNLIDKTQKPDPFKRLIPNVLDEESEDENKTKNKSNTKNELELEKPFGAIVNDNDSNLELIDDVEDLDKEDIDLEELEKEMNKLMELKKKEEDKLTEMKDIYDKDYKNYSKFHDDLNDQKRFMRMDRERAAEKRRVYEADKRAYFMMVNDIKEGKITEDKISPLFKNKYPIYKFMDDKGLLDEDDEYETFLRLFNELYPPEDDSESSNEDWIPHNYHYLTPEEKEKYKNSKSRHKDEIEEFIENNVEKKTIRPLEDILKELGDSDDDTASKDTSKDASNEVASDEESNDNQNNNCSYVCKNKCYMDDCSDESDKECNENCQNDDEKDDELPKLDNFENCCNKNPMLDKMVSILNKCPTN